MDQRVSELLARREEISYEMIEADSDVYEELTSELQEIERELELGTGQTIEELENLYYKRG